MRRLDHTLAMIMAFAVVILTLLLTAQARSESNSPEIIYTKQHTVGYIVNSPGGYVDDFLAVREILRKQNLTLKIVGECDSACTLFTDLPKACVYPTTKLGFHRPFYLENGKKVFNDVYDVWFTKQYPKKIQSWLASRGGLQADLVYLQGKQLLDLMPLCAGVQLPK
ncbi:hypothetical protein [Mesorhizobium sp. L2C067A000]|uniref:hypothetical protein n=1 Tax=Mesorhizobium sp. L2C067A000 TaxID=1287106 RepID=UPI0003CFD532|nr:hypothetical protein [Mesorhizobium sp. L2C067A000]ESZ33860.1 hypothetical protein X733_13790 [Mesorhizobium sp. L2C067A000]